MRKQKPRRCEDILFSFQHTIWTLYHTVLIKQHIHIKDIKLDSVPIIKKKKKTEKGSNGFSYNGLILELELQKFSKYHLSLHVGDFY